MLRAVSVRNRACGLISQPHLLLTPHPPQPWLWLRDHYAHVAFFLNLGELSPLHCCGDSINETDRWGQVRGGDRSWRPSSPCDPSPQKPALMPGRLSKTDLLQRQFGHLNMTLDVSKPQLKLRQRVSVVYHRGRITALKIGCVRSVSLSANEHLWPWERGAAWGCCSVPVDFQ